MKIYYLSPDAAQREFKPIDEVTSCDNLISYFNSFDWEKGNAIIAKRKSFDLPYSPQILRFQRSETDYVELSPQGKDDYFLTCLNDKLLFETFIPGNINTQQFSVEEFLEDFWSENLIDKYSFEEANDSEEADLSVESSFGILILWPLALCAFLAVMIFDGTSKPIISISTFLFSLFPIAFSLPYLILLLQYYKNDRNSSLSVNKKDKTLTIVKQGIPRTIRTKEITKARIIINTTRKTLTKDWGYLLLEIGPKERIVITTFLYKDLYALAQFLNLNPVNVTSFYPLIRLNIKSDDQLLSEKNEQDLKVQEFTAKWSGKSKEELLKIKKDVTGYAPYAIEAATKLLKKKQLD